MPIYNHSESLEFMIYKTQRKLYQFLLSRLKAYEITPEQWNILNQLGKDQGINQKELANKAYKDKTTITRILDILQRKGLIIRKVSSKDRREFFLYLTNEGVELREKLMPIEVAAAQEVLHGITVEQINLFKEILFLINRNVDNEEKLID